jgi:selT/selW/selH-like putative selenoprotein
LADAIKNEFDATVNLVASGGGIFDVALDGDIIFSKSDAGRFPEDDEIIAKIRKKSG